MIYKRRVAIASVAIDLDLLCFEFVSWFLLCNVLFPGWFGLFVCCFFVFYDPYVCSSLLSALLELVHNVAVDI